jgi:hypothetical protein
MYGVDTDLAVYAANTKAGYQIFGEGQIPDIQPDFEIKI